MMFLGGADCANPYKGGFNTQATSRPPSNCSTKFNLCYNIEWYFYTGKKVKEKGERRTDYVLTVRQELISSRLVYTLLSVHSSAIADTQPDHSPAQGWVCAKKGVTQRTRPSCAESCLPISCRLQPGFLEAAGKLSGRPGNPGFRDRNLPSEK